MLAKFNDAFKKKNTPKIPEALIKLMSKQLPEGYSYIKLDEETLVLNPNEKDRMTISIPDLFSILPKEINVTNSNEFALYIYNSQQVIEHDGNELIINGKAFNVEQLIKRPFQNQVMDKIILKPEPFPEPIPIHVSSIKENINLDLYWKRIPSNDIYIQQYGVLGIDGMNINFNLNTRDNSMSMKFNYNFKDEKSIDSLLTNLKLIRAFKENTILFDGFPLEGEVTFQEEEFEFLIASIELWEKVIMLEEFFKVKFTVGLDIEIDDVNWIERLYQSFIRKIGTKSYVPIKSFYLTTDKLLNEQSIKDLKKTGTLLSFNQSVKLNILGVTLDLFQATSWYDYVIKNVELEDGITDNSFKYQFFIDSTTNKGSIEFTTFFNDEQETNDYIMNTDLITQKYIEASFLSELINRE